MGIQTDTHLVGQQYALLGTILYIGILVGEVSGVAMVPCPISFCLTSPPIV
jgi:hypothetical protein